MMSISKYMSNFLEATKLVYSLKNNFLGRVIISLNSSRLEIAKVSYRLFKMTFFLQADLSKKRFELMGFSQIMSLLKTLLQILFSTNTSYHKT
jgi:hypothetical protein